MGKRRTEEELAAAVPKFDMVGELREKDNSTYQLIHRRGLMDKLCGHLKREHRKNMSEEDLAEIVSHYDTLRELREKEPSVYEAIRELGLLEKLCGHMEREASPPLSDDDLEKIASPYTVLKDFRNNEESAYVLIRRRGLFNKLCGQMKRGFRDLTDGLLLDIAKGDKSRDAFAAKDSSAYSTACRRAYVTLRDAGMLDKYFPTKWVKPFTENERKSLIEGCKTRSELYHKHRSIYNSLKRDGLPEKYFPKYLDS